MVMDLMQLFSALEVVANHDLADCDCDINNLITLNLIILKNEYSLDFVDLVKLVPQLNLFNPTDDSLIWKHITLNFYLLNELIKNLDKENNCVLSMEQKKLLHNSVQQLLKLGIQCNLAASVPLSLKCKSDEFYCEDDIVIRQYNRLCSVTYSFINCTKSLNFSQLVLPYSLRVILSSLYQILYCPLRQPGDQVVDNFKMTKEMYERCLKNREEFKPFESFYANSLSRATYTKETMLLLQNSKALWFKKAVMTNLALILFSQKGLQTIIQALTEHKVDFDPNDTTKTWKAFELIVNLIVSYKGAPNFKSNLCSQITDLAMSNNRMFESLFVACVKTLYKNDQDLCEKELLNVILDPFYKLTDIKRGYERNENVTKEIEYSVRVLNNAFTTQINYPDLQFNLLTPVIVVLFAIYVSVKNTNHEELKSNLQTLLLAYLRKGDSNLFYDTVLFKIPTADILMLRNDVEIIAGKSIYIRIESNASETDVMIPNDALLSFLEKDDKLFIDFFLYLLHSLITKEEYFEINEKTFEEKSRVERNVLIYSLLSSLCERKAIQQIYRSEGSGRIITYIRKMLEKALDKKWYLSRETGNHKFRILFTFIMVLQALPKSSTAEGEYSKLLETLRKMSKQCVNEELYKLVTDVVVKMESDQPAGIFVQTPSAVDKAIQDVFDPLLPVKGHGLLELSKLVVKQDEEVLERKTYIMNLFQHHLQNEDSFIYLAAIQGLAAMGRIFPDDVLEVLTEEYNDFKKNDFELRMKVGEILVKVVKEVGSTTDMSKHKSILLNTFLATTKDDDNLIRASSLSNLGEVCQVLGNQLGSMIPEILKCVQDVIETDTAVEAKRAAVLVYRQLFMGLKDASIDMLESNFKPIYKSLREIYNSHEDNTMRLQAQLALEHINEIVVEYVHKHPELTTEFTKLMISNKQC